MLKDTLEGHLGKNIDKICKNRFHTASENHCAHFVSHAVGIESSFNCRDFKGGSAAPANIRVHEVFAICPKVGKKANMDMSKDQLVFVTLASNVDIATKTMINIPQKHIGVYSGGHVYHYSNGKDKVVKQTLADFEATFQATYSGVQGIFFGHFPTSATMPQAAIAPEGPATATPADFALVQTGKTWTATRHGETQSFLVGKEFKNAGAGYFGLFVPVGSYYGPEYKGDDYAARFGHYAYLLELSGHCESKNRFNLINTYDRAKFTYGFYQLAAHTPRDNLILLMRDLVRDGVASSYFPDLKIIDGALHKVAADGGSTNLEAVSPTGPDGEEQLQAFMDYLNPRRKEIDREEVLNSAKLMHLANSSARGRELQVERSAKILEGKMARYGTIYELNGKSDLICALVADIHHQGRAKRSRVKQVLAGSNVVDKLIDINADYKQRAKDLREIIAKLTADRHLGKLKYQAGSNTFV
jgi:hypothetical protein